MKPSEPWQTSVDRFGLSVMLAVREGADLFLTMHTQMCQEFCSDPHRVQLRPDHVSRLPPKVAA